MCKEKSNMASHLLLNLRTKTKHSFSYHSPGRKFTFQLFLLRFGRTMGRPSKMLWSFDKDDDPYFLTAFDKAASNMLSANERLICELWKIHFSCFIQN